jgi:hypothetical protein
LIARADFDGESPERNTPISASPQTVAADSNRWSERGNRIGIIGGNTYELIYDRL